VQEDEEQLIKVRNLEQGAVHLPRRVFVQCWMAAEVSPKSFAKQSENLPLFRAFFFVEFSKLSNSLIKVIYI